mmetsp:Transcript_30699/g.42917  ORF Transcript_30699/g.42917 Transcript_30699/m.42917 type:complete len:89 (+) Transcript_30699:325-591(+)
MNFFLLLPSSCETPRIRTCNLNVVADIDEIIPGDLFFEVESTAQDPLEHASSEFAFCGVRWFIAAEDTAEPKMLQTLFLPHSLSTDFR